ncbi:hemerythrin domain-containing protein [Rubripirellula amarantea]|uniref:Hemerythrin HHE cation binding domain protein n=1 Tax=Rubripirellula amarantea TaxID=2527999 RepID=A0A5C5WUI7_9BACT|nr:hemerythrin domain-containing protein [Rubripirellula amarantea]MDA8745393.1 hemerythrin domain-containing protein [Rubripirellula amarantea]TWT53751.1 Hemerythrin HHE cation binding domain protein [Rubripirellula amarantea]
MSVAEDKKAIASRSLSVNAAFMKDIKDDNRELKLLMDRISPMVSHPETASNHWMELIGLLGELRDQLAFHFSLEEAYGYFDEAIETEPQLSVQAEVLRSEHTVLFETCRAIAEASSEVSSDQKEKITKLLNRFADFRNKFETHEEAELDLILNALDDDLGVGD